MGAVKPLSPEDPKTCDGLPQDFGSIERGIDDGRLASPRVGGRAVRVKDSVVHLVCLCTWPGRCLVMVRTVFFNKELLCLFCSLWASFLMHSFLTVCGSGI